MLGLEMYLKAFYRLDSGRANTGFGLPQIPWMQIEEYCDRDGIFDPEQRLIAHHHISHLDKVYLDYKKEKQGNKPSASRSPKPRRRR